MEKEDFLIILGLNIKAERVRKKLNQEQLAHLADCDRSYIGFVERGKQNPTIIKLVKISKALDVTINDLLKGLI